MPSPTVTFRLSPDLAEIAETLAETLGYPSRTDLLVGLLRYAAMVEGEHVITQPMALLSKAAQDRIDAKLLANLKLGKRERGQYLKHLLEGCDKPQDLGNKLAGR